MAALIAEVDRKGATATTVEDVVTAAGMSRKTFYEHFRNKQDCVLQTADMVIDISMREVQRAYMDTDAWPERVEAALRSLFDLAAGNPGSVRLCLIEVAGIGPEGLERRERWFAEFERFIADALQRAPDPGPSSPLVVKALVGGVAGVLSRRLATTRRIRVNPVIAELVSWITAYHPTPPELLSDPTQSHPPRPNVLCGGRAPGTLAPHGRVLRRRGLPRGENSPVRSFVVHNQRERILDAAALLTAASGYASLKVEDIAEHAALSLKAFYEHFDSKEEAFLVAYEVGHAKCLAQVEAAHASEAEWPYSVRAGIAELLWFLACEPAFARLALVDVHTATQQTAERSSIGVSTFSRLLLAGLEDVDGHGPSDVVLEAVAGAIFELCLDYVIRGETDKLPELAPVAAYVALAPVLGAPSAARTATAPRAGSPE